MKQFVLNLLPVVKQSVHNLKYIFLIFLKLRTCSSLKLAEVMEQLFTIIHYCLRVCPSLPIFTGTSSNFLFLHFVSVSLGCKWIRFLYIMYTLRLQYTVSRQKSSNFDIYHIERFKHRFYSSKSAKIKSVNLNA